MERQSPAAQDRGADWEQATFAPVNYYRKESFSNDAATALIEAIAASNDIVLTAIGD